MRSLLLLIATLAVAAGQPTQSFAWKPSTHVYLALAALDEITANVDLLGNAKNPGEVVFYRVNYATGDVVERLGAYEADASLVAALEAHRRAFVMGVLGPDAYPDIATGQARIHVRHPVHSDRWLRYLWEQAQGQDAMIRAFVLGYLTHAIGDMFMHTDVNHFAGGEFTLDVENARGNPLNFNAARHIIFESYVGTRTPELDKNDYDIGIRLVEPLREFMYRHLADARTVEHPALSPRTDTFLGEEVLARKPYLSDGDFESSIPRFFSDLRDGLVGYLNMVDDTVAAIDRQIQAIYDDAARLSCPAGVTCTSPPGDQTAGCIAACTVATGLASPHLARKLIFQAANAGPYTYVMQEWVPNIDDGLRKWLDLNHQLARLLMFAPPDQTDLAAAKDSISHYKDIHLPRMLGLPSVVGEYVVFSNSIKEMIFGDVQDAIDDMRSNLVHFLFEQAFRMSIDEFQEAYVSPQSLFDDVLPLGYVSNENIVGQTTTLAQLNQQLGIVEPGFSFPDRRWRIQDVPPAWNTFTLIKISMLSRNGLRNLLEDLGADCQGDACLPDSNPALGFMRSLDESRQWLPDDPSEPLDDPAFNRYKDPLPGFAFEDCRLYAQLFVQQLGDEHPAFGVDGRTIEARPCAPMVALDAPEINPPGGTFDAPVTVAIATPGNLSTEEADALKIYYTLQVAGRTVEPEQPRPGGTMDSRVHVYTGPFQISPPLDPSQLPITLRAKAYHPDYLPSETVVAAFDVDARLNTPVFSRTSGDYLEPFSVALTLPNAPGGSAVFYTLTGQDPDYNDTQYTGPISLTRGSHELRAVAYRPGYVRSDVASAEYRIFAPNEVERAEAPYFTSPRGSGTFTGSATVAIETDTQDGIIRWTAGLDQLPAIDPTATLGNAYTGPFNLPKGNWFIRAITVKDGLFDSPIAQINVNIVDPLGTTSAPVISPPGGVFNNDVQVRLAGAVTFVNNQGQTVTDSSGMQIQYTLDGSDPDINSNFNPQSNRRYLQPFTLNRSSTLRALAYRTFFPISEIVNVEFRFEAASPSFSQSGGVYYDSVRVALTSETANAIIRYTLDGSEPNEMSTRYTGSILLTSSASIRARAFRNGYSFSEIAEASYVIEGSEAPVIVRQPRDVEAVVGTDVELTARVVGKPEPTLQWFFEDEPLAGATDDTLRLVSVDEGDAGVYTLRVMAGAGDLVSEPGRLIVLPEPIAPEIVADLPEVLEVPAGEPVSFGVDISGSPSPGAAWYRNDRLLTGQSETSISYASADLAHAGAYRIVISNVAGADTSRSMQLVILLAANVSTESDGTLPERFELGQNYPNPFNPATSIPFSVPEPSRVRLTIYDVAGRRLAVLVDRDFGAGRFTARFDASNLASGVYLYRLEAGTWSEVRKMVLVR